MTDFDPQLRHRKSIRLKGYDYASKGLYYVTLCTEQSECLFGRVEFPKVILTEAGLMIQKTWDEMPQFYPGVELDVRIVMPNHLHGIILLSSADSSSSKRAPLGELLRRFKSLTTKRYNVGANEGAWPESRGGVWQRNYYEHIIRDETALDEIRAYIEDNPRRWAARSIGL